MVSNFAFQYFAGKCDSRSLEADLTVGVVLVKCSLQVGYIAWSVVLCDRIRYREGVYFSPLGNEFNFVAAPVVRSTVYRAELPSASVAAQ